MSECENDKTVKNVIFQNLTPFEDMELGIYCDALDYVFNQESIHNIAISGAYSSGKSSLIRSYQKEKNKNFYYISLAHFNGKRQNKEYSEETIERKIVNQLIQKAPKEVVENAGFNKRENKSKNDKRIRHILLTVLIMLFVFIGKFESIYNLIILNVASETHAKATIVTALIAAILFTGVTLWVVKSVFEYIDKHKISTKISLYGNEIQVSDDEDSFFDKNLDEILFLLANIDVNGIVFEDLDRIESIEIFEKLRELNTLANFRKNDANKPIRFFYLLKDELFIDNKDRTKFFDLIIPVIPVIDSSNSYNKIKEFLEEAGQFNKVKESFLRELSLYIDDFRILKNICNEFIIYESKLNKLRLDLTTLFAIITYKNIFPKDFAALQQNSGLIYSVIKSKEELRKYKLFTYKDELESLEKKLEGIEEEHLNSVRELDYIRNGIGLNNHEYSTRIQRIEDKNDENKIAIEKEIEEHKKCIYEIKHWTFEALVDRDTLDLLFGDYNPAYLRYINPEEYMIIQKSQYFDLLKRLVFSGYINESYIDYMSYFYENSIDANDKIFLRSVKDGEGLDYEYKLHNVSETIKYLEDEDFRCDEIANFDLADFIFTAGNKKQKQLFVDHLRYNHRLEFIREYSKYTQAGAAFIRVIVQMWPEILQKIIKDDIFNDAEVRHILLLATNNCTEQDLLSANEDGCITECISDDEYYLNFRNSDRNKAVANLHALGVKFKRIDKDKVDPELFEDVYANNLYEINEANILLFMTEKCGVNDIKVSLRSFMTEVLETEMPLYDYLAENQNDTLTVYLDMIDGGISDSSDVIVQVLNDKDIKEENKIGYIDRLSSKVNDIEEIADGKYWKHVVSNNAVEYSSSNIVNYFSKYELDVNLISFLNSEDTAIDYFQLDNEDTEAFVSKCLLCNDLRTNKYVQIVENYYNPFEEFDIAEISDDKVEALIDNGYVPMNENNLRFVREQYKEQVPYYIYSDIDRYISIAIEDMFNSDEAYLILNNNEVEDEKKLTLLENCNRTLSVNDLLCSDSIILYILENLFDSGDIAYCLQTYPDRDAEIRESMLKIFETYSSLVISNAEVADNNAIIDIFEKELWIFDDRIRLLREVASKLSKNDLVRILKSLGANKIADNLDGGRKEVEDNTINNIILQTLLATGVIEQYTKRKDDSTRYRKIRLKNAKKSPGAYVSQK